MTLLKAKKWKWKSILDQWYNLLINEINMEEFNKDEDRKRVEFGKHTEDYRNRLIDQRSLVWWKSMDLWIDRLLKDCELYVTLFGLLVAWLAFVYNWLLWTWPLRLLFFLDLIIIFVGIIRAFVLRQKISNSIEDYTLENSKILEKEIKELEWEEIPKQFSELVKKRIKEKDRLVEERRVALNKLVTEYKIKESMYLYKKQIIFIIYLLSFVVFVVILWILLFK